ncbi:hypothetical protein [Natronobacterium lacisalsi]|nr:hypothetical protein [Halobiforma lacisalsi]
MSPPPAAAWLFLGAWILMTFAVTNAAGGTQRRSLEERPVRTPSSEDRDPATSPNSNSNSNSSECTGQRRSGEGVGRPADD